MVETELKEQFDIQKAQLVSLDILKQIMLTEQSTGKPMFICSNPEVIDGQLIIKTATEMFSSTIYEHKLSTDIFTQQKIIGGGSAGKLVGLDGSIL